MTHPLRMLLLLGIALLLGSDCRGLLVFLPDADVDDDGLVDAADVAAVEACQGTVIAPPEIELLPAGCPLVVGPPPTGCESADVDASGRVDATDLGLVTQRLGRTVCNGSEALCGRRFDQVAYATTHNAMAARFAPYEYSILVSNQCDGPPAQLRDGIRALMLDFHWYQPPGAPAPSLHLCHAECGFGSQPLVEGLAEIRAFLDANPAEVIAFIVEINAGTAGREAEIRDAFAASGLLAYVHTQTPGAPWPTLQEMIDADRRLVVLTADSDASGCGDTDPCDWYHYLWGGFAFETPFSNATPADFTCADLRGAPGDDLFILNHFLTQNLGAPQLAEQVNHMPELASRSRECWRFQGQLPNFVTVDFYEIGDVVRATDLLNFLHAQTAGAPPP